MGEKWKKFRLLLWKNFILRRRHVSQTIFEILIPLCFSLILVVIRGTITPIEVPNKSTYPSFLPTDINYTVVPKRLYILYAPDTPQAKEIIQPIQQKFRDTNMLKLYQFIGYRTEETLLNKYRNEDKFKPTLGVNPVLAGVVFKRLSGVDIKYTLRFPATLHGPSVNDSHFGLKPRWLTEYLYELFPRPRVREAVPPDERDPAARAFLEHGGYPGYWREGFLFLQTLVDTEIVKMKAKASGLPVDAVDQYQVRLQRYPYPGYIDDDFIVALQVQYPLFIMFSYIYSVINIAKAVTYEKEKRLKESMKIMGLDNWLHWTAWFTRAFLSLTVSSTLITMLYKIKWSSNGPILPNSNWSLVFIFFLSVSYSSITLGFLVTTFFSSANSASTAAGVIFFLTYFPYFFLRPRYQKTTTAVKIGLSLFGNTAMALGCHVTAIFEGHGLGIQWDRASQLAGPEDDITIFQVISLLLFDGTMYFLAAVYIESVFPGEYGIPLPWYYPFTKWYWTGAPRSGANADVTESPSTSNQIKYSHLFEKEPQGRPGIQIKGLTKKFGKKVAVNNLSLTLYEGQVTALLGHNGAGKTTTMSMLTGLIPPTSGTAIVNGYDIRTDIHSVRGSLGLCPQHDVLWEELTVAEHLKFFCLLKGVNKTLVGAEVDRMLGAMKLENKRHAQSQTLSGGMKRKLSVGIALIGGSKTVLLDEATAGQDPGARRSTWDLITSEKKGRTILLSTHFMDEADLLGDRIAILAAGQARCFGSSLFLKKKFGGGYHLIIVKEEGNCKVDEITQLIQKRIPEVTVDQNIGAELSYSLPDEMASVFPEMFDELEQRKEQLGIASYGCSITQMEEIFIRVGKQVEKEQLGNKPEPSVKAPIHLDHPVTENTEIQEKLSPIKTTANLETVTKEKSVNDDDDQLTSKSEGMVPSNEKASTSVQNKDPHDAEQSSGMNSRKDCCNCKLLIQQFRAMLVKRWLLCIRNKIFVISQVLIPVLFLTIAMIMFKTLPNISMPRERMLDLKDYAPAGKPTPITTVQCENVSAGICRTYIDLAAAKSKIEFTNNLDFEEFILKKSKDNGHRVKFRYLVALKVTGDDTNITGYFNNQPFHSPALALNLISNAILRQVTKNNRFTLTTSNHPLPYSDAARVENLVETESEGFSIGLNVSFGLSFLAGSFVVFVIKERETKSKHLQFISGVRFPIFWLAHLLFDVVLFVLSIFALMITLTALQAKDFSGENTEMLAYFFLVLIFYAWAIIPFMYICSLMFVVPSSGYTKMTLFNFLTGMTTFLTMAILQLETLQLKDVAAMLEWFFMIFPNFDVGYSLSLLTLNRQLHNICSKVMPYLLLLQPKYCSDKPKFPCCSLYEVSYLSLKEPGIGRHMLYLFAIGVICSIALLMIESHFVNTIKYKIETKKVSKLSSKQDLLAPDSGALKDTDVEAENRRIRETDLASLFQTENMVLKDLTKFYGDFVAVDQLCLGVRHGECFGLLGINGAGKTTCFKMLTGDIHISYGDAYVNNKSVKKEIRRVQKVVGYCPQFDALIPEITGRETIRLFARLRGIPEIDINSLVDELGRDLLFSEYLDKPCGTYSGGNKRKLSVAVSLVGNPPVILLDEPSAGIDPVARRHLWNAIIKLREKGLSVVLTSHSMEECEALCTRLAIMVNGKLRCLGSTQHLKNKFGDGYTIIAQMEVKCQDYENPRKSVEVGRRRSSVANEPQTWETELHPLRNFIEEKFPDCDLREVHPGYVQYHIKEEAGVTWGAIFRTMEEAKNLFTLEAYSVGQTSLEQVFLSFTKGQV